MIRKIIISILMLLILSAPGVNAQRQWEEVASELVIPDGREDVEVLDISVREGYVYVTTSKPVTVKIFSILGQLIAQKNLPVGTSRTKISARGIYILKVGTVTRRVTI